MMDWLSVVSIILWMPPVELVNVPFFCFPHFEGFLSMFDLLFSIISVTLGISETTALHRPDDWANGGGGGTNHSFPRRRAVHFDLLFLSAAVLLFLSNCLRHGIGSFHPRYDVFLILICADF